MKIFLFLVLGSVITFLLAGCAETNTHFSCDKVGGKGVGCVSLGTANKMVDQGYFNKSNHREVSEAVTTNKKAANPSESIFNDSNVDWRPRSGLPLRFGETVQNIWIAPFVDMDGNYHWPQTLSLVISPGHWVGAPQSEIAMSGGHDD